MADREQEQSIKDRKRLLYEDDDPMPSAPVGDRKPFAIHLRETPAAPLPASMKAALWGAGVVVALLLAAAAWKASQAKPRPGADAPATRSAR